MSISQLYIALFAQTLSQGQASAQWSALFPGSWVHWELEPADRFSAPVGCWVHSSTYSWLYY